MPQQPGPGTYRGSTKLNVTGKEKMDPVVANAIRQIERWGNGLLPPNPTNGQVLTGTGAKVPQGLKWASSSGGGIAPNYIVLEASPSLIANTTVDLSNGSWFVQEQMTGGSSAIFVSVNPITNVVTLTDNGGFSMWLAQYTVNDTHNNNGRLSLQPNLIFTGFGPVLTFSATSPNTEFQSAMWLFTTFNMGTNQLTLNGVADFGAGVQNWLEIVRVI